MQPIPSGLKDGSLLADIWAMDLGGLTLSTTNPLRPPGPGLARQRYCPDGVIEAVEAVQGRFVLGVQWHPERMVQYSEAARSIFARFVDAAR